jgi:hypothetical protein
MGEESSPTHDVFLSYSSHDKNWADAACAVLERHRIRCWIAPRDITPGDEWGASIIKGINGSRMMVLIFSGHANASVQVSREVERAISLGMTVLPVRVEDVRPVGSMEFHMSNIHWLDAFTPPIEWQLELLARSVKTLLGVESSVARSAPIAESPPAASARRPRRRRAVARSAPVTESPPRRPREERDWVPCLYRNQRLTYWLKSVTRRLALRFHQLIHRSSTAADPVDCTVFAPPSAAPGVQLIVQVFAHRPDQTKEAKSLAKEIDEETQRRGFKSLEMQIEHGTRLQVHLHLPGIEFGTPIQDIVWQGRPNYVAFDALVPSEFPIGNAIGRVTVSRVGVPIGSIAFKIKILDEKESQPTDKPLMPAGEIARRYRKAFISYASPDRPEVLKRVQGLRIGRIRYFQDVLKLEPGDRWERKLYLHIDKSDLFLLFWSTHAKKSEWVLKEVRYALERKRGDEFARPEIIPVIIEGPPVPKPPEELAHLHFNDYLIYFMEPQDLKQ